VAPSRRGVLGTALLSAALTVPAWSDALDRTGAVATGRLTRIGLADVDVVVRSTHQLSVLDDQFGARPALPPAAAFLRATVAPYLRAQASPDVRRALLSAASDLCYLTGYMAVDENLHGLAQRYYRKALDLARAAEDSLRYGTTLRGMSVQAANLGHGPQAMRLADAAVAASPDAGPRMRAFLAGQQAHAAAQIGDSASALRLMSEAERALDQADSRPGTFGRYDASALHYHVSMMRLEFGDVAGAVDAMQESDRVRHDVYRRSRVHHRGMLAQRQLRLGRLEEACATYGKALDDYPLVQSGRCDVRMREIARLLAPYAKNVHARAVLAKARSLGVAIAV
jgi:tetratricopeptide (TPR) repeat protein